MRVVRECSSILDKPGEGACVIFHGYMDRNRAHYLQKEGMTPWGMDIG